MLKTGRRNDVKEKRINRYYRHNVRRINVHVPPEIDVEISSGQLVFSTISKTFSLLGAFLLLCLASCNVVRIEGKKPMGIGYLLANIAYV